MPPLLPTALSSRSLLSSNQINIAFGILALVVGIVGIIPAWATWRVRHRQGHISQDSKFLERYYKII
jgi:hypothetical protein